MSSREAGCTRRCIGRFYGKGRLLRICLLAPVRYTIEYLHFNYIKHRLERDTVFSDLSFIYLKTLYCT